MSRVGILNTIAEAPVKPLVQKTLELYPSALLINPSEEYLNGQCPLEIPEEVLKRFQPTTYDRIVHDGSWQNMSKFSQQLIKRALENGTTIQIINGRKGE